MAAVAKLSVYVGLRDVPKLDMLSESDPFVVLSVDGRRVGTTEIVKNNPNPDFTHSFTVPYSFNVVQQLEIAAYDADTDDTRDLSKHDFVGRATFTMADLMRAQSLQLRLPLTGGPRGAPSVVVSAEELAESSSDLVFAGEGTGSVRGCGLELLKSMEGGALVPVASVAPAKAVEARCSVARLCNMDMERSICIRAFKKNCFGTQRTVAECFTRLSELVGLAGRIADGGRPAALEFFEPGRPGKQPRSAGTFLFRRVALERTPSFVDYLQSGLQISLQASVDFTGSNGEPSRPDSLHHYVPGAPNAPTLYHVVLDAVGRILLQYDADGCVPAFGFGAIIQQPGQLTTQGSAAHLFPLDPLNAARSPHPGVFQGLGELIQAYYNTIVQVCFSGPTNFAPFLRHLREGAAAAHQQMRQPGAALSFQVGLILTDGAISDMQDTIDEIVALSSLPAALIIVGVGNADFTKMDILDADDSPLYSRAGQRQAADIVQFVPFNRYAANPPALAAAVLEELPAIVLHYMQANRIQPAPRPPPPPAVPGMPQLPAQPGAGAPPPPPPGQPLPSFVI